MSCYSLGLSGWAGRLLFNDLFNEITSQLCVGLPLVGKKNNDTNSPFAPLTYRGAIAKAHCNLGGTMTFLSIWNTDSGLLLAQHVSTGHSSWALLGGLAALITAVAGLISAIKNRSK